MELMDIMDKVTPISGDSKEFIPPYIGNGHSGRTLSLNRTEASGVRIHSGPLLIPVERFFNFVSELLMSKYFLPLTISCKTPINVDCNLYDQGRNQVGKSCILRGINNLLILNL